MYVLVVPSSAVTFTLTVLLPSFKVTFPVPSTFAFLSNGVAYTVTSFTLLGTVVLYSVLSLLNPVKSLGVIPKLLNLASDDFFVVVVVPEFALFPEFDVSLALTVIFIDLLTDSE